MVNVFRRARTILYIELGHSRFISANVLIAQTDELRAASRRSRPANVQAVLPSSLVAKALLAGHQDSVDPLVVRQPELPAAR